MIKKLLTFFISICLLFSLVSVQPTHAAQNFTTDYRVTYTINENGTTSGVINATLTNTSSQYYAASYKMQIGFSNITNVRAQDSLGPITPKVTKNQDGYVVDVTFNKKAVGLGSKQDFAIAFDTPALARHYGNIWEIDIPGIANPNDFSNFVVDLKVPPSFGEPAYIKPKQPSNALTFTKETLGKSGISIAFGKKQVYKFNLTYHLRNPNLYPVKTEIALPPTTNYQDVFINNISPRPDNVIQDKEGNWLAQYRLTSAQKMDVTVHGNAEVNLNPKPVELSPEDEKLYLGESKYWEVNDDRIRELADELRTPDAIYAYVVNALKYDFSRVTEEKPRLGAVGALQNPNSAVCREFTDLFITLARAAGIPARQIDGYAYTENAKQRPLAQSKDILHVWPEYYDREKKTWVMVDPTWGSTTGGVNYFDVMDFAHFAFVIKGQKSEYPIPAGGYKFTDEPLSKDVHVEFSTDVLAGTSAVETETTLPEVAIAGFPVSGKVIVNNNGNSYVPPQILYITSDTYMPGTQTLATAGIPPFGRVEVPVKFKPTAFLTNTEGAYTIRVAGVSGTHSMKAAPFYLTPKGGIISGILAFIIFFAAYQGRRLRLSRQR